MAQDIVLVPYPRKLTRRPKSFRLSAGRLIRLLGPRGSELLSVGTDLQKFLKNELDLTWEVSASPTGPESEVGITLRVDERLAGKKPDACALQSYQLTISPTGIEAVAPSATGVFHAVMTLRQLVIQSGRRLPCLVIEDQPDFATRGVMLDISRDRVPTMRTLHELVDMLASWKINQLQLYTEHTFAYRNHPLVWKHASPMTGEEILELDWYCRERHVDLVPNQNSFGHMERWFKHRRYRALSEAPHGFVTPWGRRRPMGTSLCPTDPGSLKLIGSLYEEFLPHFSSQFFNVGCDETWDLGQGRSKKLCERRGVGRVYLDFLLKVYRLVKSHGRTMMFWGDIVMKHPELVDELPRDLIAMEWGYGHKHDFAGRCAKFAEAKVPFYVCPGTSTWNSIVGRTDNMLGNLKNAARNGLASGAVGLLNTDWGDLGHWQPMPVSFGPYAYGAAVSWCLSSSGKVDLARALDVFAFRDRARVMGKLSLDMGNLYKLVGPDLGNKSIYHLTLIQGTEDTFEPLEQTTPEEFEKAEEAIRVLVGRLSSTRMEREDASLIKDEYRNSARLLRHGCRLARAKLNASAKGRRPALAGLIPDMRVIIGEFRRLWLERSRPGGLADSVGRLEKLLAYYMK